MSYPYVSLPELPPGHFYVFDFDFNSERHDKEGYVDLDIRADPTEEFTGGQLLAYFPLQRDGPTRGEAREVTRTKNGWEWSKVQYDNRNDAISATVAKMWMGVLTPID